MERQLLVPTCGQDDAFAFPGRGVGSDREGVIGGGLKGGDSQPDHAEDYVRVGTVVQPLLSFRIPANAGIVAFPSLHIGNDLEMQMGRPVAVLEAHAELCDHFSAANASTLFEIFQ